MVVDRTRRNDDENLADLQFGALADRTRRDIFRRAHEGRLSVSALAREYPISLAAVQKHVAVLERAELVSKHRVGRESIVRAEPEALERARAALEALAAESGAAGSSESTASSTTKRRQLMPVTDVKKDLDALTMTITARVRCQRRANLGDVVGPAAAGALVGAALVIRRPSSSTTSQPAVAAPTS